MHILAFDTSASVSGIALASDEHLVAESLFTSDRTLSTSIIPEMQRLLHRSGITLGDIDLFACAIGPGSFTGVRCGVATVQGLALATGRRCVGYATLDALAMNFPVAPYPVCTLLDARKNEVYGALYDAASPLPSPVIYPCVSPPATFIEQVAATVATRVIFAGDGAVRYHEIISGIFGDNAIFAPFPHNSSRPSCGCRVAIEQHRLGKTLDSPAKLLPLYIRLSEAELSKAVTKVPTPDT